MLDWPAVSSVTKMADKDDRARLRTLRSLASKLHASVGAKSTLRVDTSIKDIAIASIVGGLSFPACLGSLQAFIFGPSRVTNNRLIAGPVCGFLSVFLSGSVASAMFVSCVALSSGTEEFFEANFGIRSVITEKAYSFKFELTDLPVCGLLSMAVFKVLGGRLRSVLPSNLAHPGAFARISLPASGRNYASEAVKRELANIGKKYGCHSCGRRWRVSFVGDHMPPNKLAKPKQVQRFYPQCTGCSNKQGSALATMSKHRFIRTHGSSLRVHHLWLPVPLLLMWIRNIWPPSHTTNNREDSQKQSQKSK